MTKKPTPAGGWRAPETQNSDTAILNANWPQINDVRRLALTLAERGAPITLCRNKKPFSEAWQEKTWTPAEVAEAFRDDPELGLGLVLGRRSGLVDVETDDPDADLTSLFHGAPPETPTFQSRRGIHRLFLWDDRLDVTGKARIKVDGGDILIGAGGKGAQCLLPPSVSDGFRRNWINPPPKCPFAPLPKSLLDNLLQLTVPLDLEAP